MRLVLSPEIKSRDYSESLRNQKNSYPIDLRVWVFYKKDSHTISSNQILKWRQHMLKNLSNTNGRKIGPKNQAGYSAIELGIGLVVVTALLILLAPRLSSYLGSTSQNVGTLEVNKIVQASRNYKQITGSYASITLANLVTGGYGLEEYTDGDGENAYNLTVSVAPVTGNATAQVTYVTGSAADCTQLINRVAEIDGVTATSCSTATATITIA